MATTQTRGWPKGAIKNRRTGKMLTNAKGEPILKGTAAATRAGYGASFFNKNKGTARSQTQNRTLSRSRSQTGTKRNTSTTTLRQRQRSSA